MVNMKSIVFWNMRPCSLVDCYQRFGRTCNLIFRVLGDRGSRLLRNVGSDLPDNSVTFRKTVIFIVIPNQENNLKTKVNPENFHHKHKIFQIHSTMPVGRQPIHLRFSLQTKWPISPSEKYQNMYLNVIGPTYNARRDILEMLVVNGGFSKGNSENRHYPHFFRVRYTDLASSTPSISWAPNKAYTITIRYINYPDFNHSQSRSFSNDMWRTASVRFTHDTL
jgi:hypothetical protein